jgi:ornithine decarboxylase
LTLKGEYSEFGIPATILAHYLRENGIVPEKCDLNSILFLLTPAESAEKWRSWWRCWGSLNSILSGYAAGRCVADHL